MDTTFEIYMRSIDMGDPLIRKATEFYDAGTSLLSESFDQIFISEVVQQNASRLYQGIHFFSNHYVFEVANFVAEPRIFIAKLDDVGHINFYAHEFDFLNASPASRLNASVRWRYSEFLLDLRASGQNCTHLVNVIKLRLLTGR